MIFKPEPKIERITTDLKHSLSNEPLVAMYPVDEEKETYALRILVYLPEFEDPTILPGLNMYDESESIFTRAGNIMVRNISITYFPKKQSTFYTLFSIALEYTIENPESIQAIQAIRVFTDDHSNPKTKRGTVTTVMRPNT